MSLRPLLAKLLVPSALCLLFAAISAGPSGCSDAEATVQCDADGLNCMICDAYGCHPANPSVSQGGGGGGGGGTGGQGGQGGGSDCDPNVTTCGCVANSDCPSGTLCLDGLCLVGCNHSYECGPGKVCANGQCAVGCGDNKPCDTGYVCDKGVCVADPATSCPGTPCAAAEACIDGICQPDCTTNADCAAGEICDSTGGGCIPDPSPQPNCGPDKVCPGAAQCGTDGYCHYACADLTACKLIDNRFIACDVGVCKTNEEVNPECTLDKPCPDGKDCISNKCL
jgi:Cys-rich repeat protein